MKKILALVLVALLALSMTAALAHEAGTTVTGTKFTYEGTGATTNGSIKVTNATKDVTYTLYKIFDATYNSKGDVAYTTKNNTAWDSDYFKVSTQADSNGNYAVTRAMQAAPDDKKPVKTDAELFTYLKGMTANFTNIGAIKASADGAIEWEKIPYGYYIIVPNTPSSGAAVTINSAVPTANVIDKNQGTTYDKQETVGSSTYYDGIIIDSDAGFASSGVDAPSASVGDTVNYKISGTWTRYIGENVVLNLKFSDTMTDGLTANKDVAIKINSTTLDTYNEVVDGVTTKVGEGSDILYTVTYTLGDDDCWTTSIEIPTATDNNDGSFTYLNDYAVTNTYEITYSAEIDTNAVTDGEEINTVTLTYDHKDDSDVEIGKDKTKVVTYKFQLVKLDGDGKALTGAEFRLYADEEKTTEILIVEDAANEAYHVADDTETEYSTIKAGKPFIKGLKAGTYYLAEVKAPDGYNLLEDVTAVDLTNGDNVATFYVEKDTKPEGKVNGDYMEGGVSVTNLKGTVLPTTGGVGTMIFYVVGGLLVLGAVIFLVTKRRMSSDD